MIRCKPLLGTFVEISINDNDGYLALENAFAAIEKVQNLMGFHNHQSELCKINRAAHLEAVEIHPWTAQVIRVAKKDLPGVKWPI